MSWFSQADFDEVEKQFRDGLREGLRYHLENDAETEATVSEALPIARKEWEAAGGEIAAIALLARVAAETWRRLFTDFGKAATPSDRMPFAFKRFALESQLSRYLEMYRFEAIMAETDAQVARLRAEMKEDGRNRLSEIADLEARKTRLIAGFYNAVLPMDDDGDDNGAAPALCASGPVNPRKGPGEGKAWEAADELPRNP